jgi:hypothetical protein
MYYLICGGVAWKLGDIYGVDGLPNLRATIREAVKERSVIYVMLWTGEQLLINGARLECALVWDDQDGKLPPPFVELPKRDYVFPEPSKGSPLHK